MDICLIWAHARKPLAARSDSASWLGAEDLRRFQSVAGRHPVVMGYRTWEAAPRALLEGRQTFVLTQRKTSIPGAIACTSLHEAFTLASVLRSGKLFLLGGATVLQQGLRVADRVYVAQLDAEIDAEDDSAPAIDTRLFEPVLADPTSNVAAWRRVQEYRRRPLH